MPGDRIEQPVVFYLLQKFCQNLPALSLLSFSSVLLQSVHIQFALNHVELQLLSLLLYRADTPSEAL